MIVGYKLLEDATQNVVTEWGGIFGVTPDIPNPVKLPNGDRVHGVLVNQPFNGYVLKVWEMDAPE